MRQKDFVLTLQNIESPILITVPHGGMSNRYGSWLNTFFQKRIKSKDPKKNRIKGEKIVIGSDNQIFHVVSDILKEYQANAVVGLLPRSFVDYNRFVPEVAYADQKIKPFYDAYHENIKEILLNLQTKHEQVYLFDFHGFGIQPMEDKTFDIILGTNGESSPNGLDKFFYNYLKREYEIFCAGMDDLPGESELYKGDTTNLFYFREFKNLESMLVEISPKFRSTKILGAESYGKKLALDLACFFKELEIRSLAL